MTSDPRKSTDWKWWRAETIIRDNYECQSCGAKGGRKGDAELEAHHIKPVSEGGETTLENLKTLCKPCHSAQHGHSTDGLKSIEIDNTECPIESCNTNLVDEEHAQIHTIVAHRIKTEEFARKMRVANTNP